MRWTSALVSAAALVTRVTCQDDVETFDYCDELERCFNAYTVADAGITYGIATPQESPEGFDLILQVTGEIASVGWAGLAWGGAMTYNPIAIVWPNGDDVQISSRMAFGYFVPPLFEDTTYTVLPGTTVNDTHFTVTALCHGCSSWEPLDATPTVLNGDGENYFAFAFSSVPVDDPTNIDTTFGIHDRVGHWIHNLDHAKSAEFETWAAEAGDAPEAPEEGTPEETTAVEAPPAESSPAEEEPPAESSPAEEEPPAESSPVEETPETPVETPAEGDGESTGAIDTPTTLLTTATTPPDSAPTGPTGGEEEGEEGGQEGEQPPAALPLPTACPGIPEAAYPVGTAPGWRAVKISGSVSMPRAVVEDTRGNLLVLEAGRGLSVQTLDAADGCISSSRQLIEDPSLNHGLGLSPDGSKLYVSSMTTAWELGYDAEAQTVSEKRVVVRNMYSGGHPTRSLVIPPATPNLLVMQLGSNANFDMDSLNIKTARANVKVFDVEAAPEGGWDWVTEGWDLGYGLRNDVALAVDGNNMVWSAENSADDLTRTADDATVDVHIDNPAEELNFLGDPSQPNTDWYGYPVCFTVGNPTPFVDATFTIGDQFLLTPNETFTDDICEQISRPPRLAIQAHSAPIGAAFDLSFENLYVTLHGSWNRQPATGYKVIQIPFAQLEDGSYDPVATRDSGVDGYIDIMWNENVESCTGATCLRPSGITWDRAGTRMFVASDSARAGELFLLYQEEQAR